MRVDCSGDFAMTILRSHSSRILFYSSVVASYAVIFRRKRFLFVPWFGPQLQCVRKFNRHYSTVHLVLDGGGVLRAGWWSLVIALPLKSAPPLFDIKCLISKLEDGQVLGSIASQW